MPGVNYILGHSDSELRRLMFQAAILRPITERLLQEAGLVRGMRVLDIGSGAGDVAMLAAELVGPTGSVVGVDRSAETLAMARERAAEAGHRNIKFLEGEAEDLPSRMEFDFAIGRYVLVHQADPAKLIQAVASHVRPGGAVAFHEVGLYGEARSLPPVALYTQVWSWVLEAFNSVMLHPDAGGRMIAHFRAAGLSDPKMFCDVPVGGGRESAVYAWIVLTLHNLLPHLEKMGSTSVAEVDIDTLEERLAAAVIDTNAQILGPMQFCGWSHCAGGEPRYH